MDVLSVVGKATATALPLPKSLTETEWLEIGERLGLADRSVMWWIGDWLKHKYPEGYVERGVYDELEEKTGIRRSIMAQALYVCKSVESSIRIEELGFHHHQLIAPLHQQDQKKWLAKAAEGTDGKPWTVRQLRDAIGVSKTPDLPNDKYRIIYADPPWQYGNAQHGIEEQETVLETHYKTMSDDALLALPVGTLSAPESVLFCWATSPRIEFALQLITAWGFAYKAMFIWDKVKHNVGYYNSVRHELLLICTRGSCLPDNKELHDSVVSIERTEHSAKPGEFRELIDKMYTKGKRVELWARGDLPAGWDGWGNEYEQE